MRPIAFLDTETDGLDWDRQAWEYGLVLVETEAVGGGPLPQPYVSSWVWHVGDFVPRLDSEEALRIGGYHQRHGREQVAGPNGVYYMESLNEIMASLDDLLEGAQIIGSAPWFDTHIIERDMGGRDRHLGDDIVQPMAPRWYHRMRDIGSVATGYFRDPNVGGLDDVAKRLGIDQDEHLMALRHTAIGDCLLTKACWEHMMGPIR